MAELNIKDRIIALEEQISLLPEGSVGKKTINGKDYFYLRWTEDKKGKEKYIPADEVEGLKDEIAKRKVLEKDSKICGNRWRPVPLCRLRNTLRHGLASSTPPFPSVSLFLQSL